MQARARDGGAKDDRRQRMIYRWIARVAMTAGVPLFTGTAVAEAITDRPGRWLAIRGGVPM